MKRNRINPVNRKRKAKNFARAYGGKERRAWIVGLPCIGCGYHGPTPRDPAHTKTGGTGYKSDARWLVPLCPPCHRTQHGKHGWEGIGLTREKAQEIATFLNRKWAERHGTEANDEGTNVLADAEGAEDADP